MDRHIVVNAPSEPPPPPPPLSSHHHHLPSPPPPPPTSLLLQRVARFCGVLQRQTSTVDMDVERDPGAATRRRQRRTLSLPVLAGASGEAVDSSSLRFLVQRILEVLKKEEEAKATQVQSDTDAAMRWSLTSRREEEKEEEDAKMIFLSILSFLPLLCCIWVSPVEYPSSGYFWETTSSSFSALLGSTVDTFLPLVSGSHSAGVASVLGGT